MRVQVLIAMGQDKISKSKAGNILDQHVHLVVTTQKLRHSTRKFVRLTSDYIGTEGILSKSMATWPRNIYCFECQYNKAFVEHRLFREDIVDRIHNRVQVFLHSFNTTSLEDMETGALEEFR